MCSAAHWAGYVVQHLIKYNSIFTKIPLITLKDYAITYTGDFSP